MASFEDMGRALRDRLDVARKEGAATYEDDASGGNFVIMPRNLRQATARNPFKDAPSLLNPPSARAAYSDRSAWLMAELSALAYKPFESDLNAGAEMMNHLRSAGFNETVFFNDDACGTQAFLTVRPSAFAVLAFRGTEKNRKDIFADLDARFYHTPAGKSHRGFTECFQGVEQTIRDTLDDVLARHPDLPIFFSGHSLGGALATVAAKTLEQDYLIAACYTFGSPRVGNAEWSDSLKTNVYRVVHGADGVPIVPASAMLRSLLMWLSNFPILHWLRGPVQKLAKTGFIGYQHVGDLRFITGSPANGTLKSGSAATFDRLRHVAVGKVVGAIKTLNPKALSATFGDHAIAGYTGILRSIAEQRNT